MSVIEYFETLKHHALKKGLGRSSVVEHLCCMCKAGGSSLVFSTAKTNEKKKIQYSLILFPSPSSCPYNS